MTLSRRQAQIVSLVRGFHALTGDWPADRDIARWLGLSRSTVRSYAARLADRGVLHPGTTLRLVEPPILGDAQNRR